MREVGPVEKAIAAIERFEREMKLIKMELAAELPEEPTERQDWLTHPITGERVKIKRR